MKRGKWLSISLAVCVLIALLALWISTAPKHPVALIRIVDAAGKPVSGAVIQPDGLRTKSGPYDGGHYGWGTNLNGVANVPVISDENGYALVAYPKYVFERIETGQISFSVTHPEFVPDRPFRVIATAPPAGAPWQVWFADLRNRIQRKTLTARADPVVLQKGAVLKVLVRPGGLMRTNGPLLVQVSEFSFENTNLWAWPEPGAAVTRQLGAGLHTVRALQLASDGSTWFSEVISITATAEQTNVVVVDLKRGSTVRGILDMKVTRPVTNGRVVANVWPLGHLPKDSPPEWHDWSSVGADGSFEISNLPPGDLEIVALCDGFVSTNGAGQFQTSHPQKHILGTNDLTITVGMEQTARLEVRITDDNGNPVEGASAETWPNVRYGEWGSRILMSDCYNSLDWLLAAPKLKSQLFQPIPDFNGVSDRAGLAVIPNLPTTVKSFSVRHPLFVMPAVTTPGSGKHRQASVTLVAGQTNRVSVQLEPAEQSPIAHY